MTDFYSRIDTNCSVGSYTPEKSFSIQSTSKRVKPSWLATSPIWAGCLIHLHVTTHNASS